MVSFEPVMEFRHALDKLNQLKGLTYAEQGTYMHTYEQSLMQNDSL